MSANRFPDLASFMGPDFDRECSQRDTFIRARRSLEAQIYADCALRGIVALPVDDPPKTLAGLRLARTMEGSGRIPVLMGHSERTIYSTPRANHRYRAWHDTEHLLLNRGMDFDGERAVALAGLERVHGVDEKRLLWIESYGQVAYRARHGAFPYDQRAFAEYAWIHGLGRAVERGGF